MAVWTKRKALAKLILTALLGSSLTLTAIISCSNNENTNNSAPGLNPPNQVPPTQTPPNQGGGTDSGNSPETGNQPDDNLPQFNENKEMQQAVNLAINNQSWSKITKRNLNRNINRNVYETDLTRRFRDSFKYPAWNYNYRVNYNNVQDVFDYGADGTNETPVPYRALFANQEVWRERTNFVVENDPANGNPIHAKYNDPRFILNEIKNNRLKKHPAADQWYRENVQDLTKAVEKQFSIPTNALGPTALGLYIPAGEIAILKFSDATLAAMKEQNINNFKIILNSSYWENKVDSGSGGISDRYPFVKTSFSVDLESLKENDGKFKFGSPFGGTISIWTNARIKNPQSSIFYSGYQNYDFTISGAVEMLSYMHNVTTKADWDEQIKRVKSGEISSPAMAIDFALGSTNIAATKSKEFAGVPYDQIVYPQRVVEKWTNFLFLSNFIASRDKGRLMKFDFEFSNDVWGGASAWGGGDAAWMPLSWPNTAFLQGVDNWTTFANWGIFHEVNHSYQQNSALFKRRTHGETSQLITIVLALLSDRGSFKNLYNPVGEIQAKGEWSKWLKRTANTYNTIDFINTKTKSEPQEEVELSTLITYLIGPYNMIDYFRSDVYKAPNTANGWTGYNEIIQLSDAFKINFWPALANFSRYWADGWNESGSTAMPTIQNELERLNRDYKAFKFVGNLYATGTYLWNEDINDYVYTSDADTPISVAAGIPYVFDFEKGINSLKINPVQWDELIFNETTKLGGRLLRDESNPKKLTYQPPKNVHNQVDEFDIAIRPTNLDVNYVSQYKWKVKLNLVTNLPLLTTYKDPIANTNNINFVNDWPYMKDVNNFAFQAPIKPHLGILSDPSKNGKQWEKARLTFNFVAPESGLYDFKVKGDSWMFIDVDEQHKEKAEQVWWKATEVPSRKWINTKQLNLQKNELVKFDVYLTHKRQHTKFEMQALVNQSTYNVFDHALTPAVKDLVDDPSKLVGTIFSDRYIDSDYFQSNLISPNSIRPMKIIDKANYTFYDKNNNDAIDKKLATVDNQNWETWGTNNQPHQIDFSVKFKNIQKVGNIIFHHRTDNWYEARATKMIIKDQDDKILYNDLYGKQFNDRARAYSIFNLGQIFEVSQLKFTLINEKIVSGKKSAISLNAIEFSQEPLLKVNRVLAMQDPNIQYYGPNWQTKYNDELINVSAINGAYVTTNGQYENFETTIFASGFDLIGQKGPGVGEFDLYINDKLVATYNLNQPLRLDQQIIASFSTTKLEGELLKIKVVNKSNKPLYFDYIQTYGNKVQINPKEK